MAEKDKENESGGGTATATETKPKQKPKRSPQPKPPQPLPPWKVLLHNDNKNSMDFVVLSILELTPLNETSAINSMLEAHERGVALLLTTHRERAELYQDQFQTKGLKVSIEPAE